MSDLKHNKEVKVEEEMKMVSLSLTLSFGPPSILSVTELRSDGAAGPGRVLRERSAPTAGWGAAGAAKHHRQPGGK